MSAFIPRNLTEIEAVTGCTFACIGNTIFRMFSHVRMLSCHFFGLALRKCIFFHYLGVNY